MPWVWSDTVSILVEPGWRFAMQGIKLLLFIAAGVLIAGSLQADIYEWTDENGVKHFTNYAPPDDATILMKTEEVPYDEAADRARIEADKKYQLELAMQEIAAREAELQRREAEAERNAAAAAREVELQRREAEVSATRLPPSAMRKKRCARLINTWKIPAMTAGTIVVVPTGVGIVPPVTDGHFTAMKPAASTG